MSGTPETRSSLLARIRNPRDGEAWREFLSIYEPLIYRVARRRGLQDADAREVTQEVLTAIGDSLVDWNPTVGAGSFRRWLSRVARNRAINLQVHQSRQSRGTGESKVWQLLENHPQPDGEALFDEEYRRQLFRIASDQVRSEFTKNSWGAFWQTSVVGRSVNGVAEQFGMSVGAVYTARSRVLARLKAVVEEMETSFDEYAQ